MIEQKEKLTSENKKVFVGFFLATLVTLFLFLPFLSIQFDLNGLPEVLGVKLGGQGDWKSLLFTPNHLLYAPIGLITVKLVHIFNSQIHVVTILKCLTAVLSSLGIGLFFVTIFKLTKNIVTASIFSTLLATSWSYWAFSTDIYYITPAALFVIGAIFVLLFRSKSSTFDYLVIGFLTSIAILFWQANIFLIPSLVVGIFLKQKLVTFRNRLIPIGLFLITIGITVGFSYLFVGIQIHQNYNLNALSDWLFSHSSKGEMPFWGKFSWERIPMATEAALASFIPVREGLGIQNLFKGIIRIDRIFSLISVVAVSILGGTFVVKLIFSKPSTNKEAINIILWLCFSYIMFIPFIIWWDPSETKWFVIPNIFLVMAIAKTWNQFQKPIAYVFMGISTITIALANFTATILPRHVKPNPNIELAQCVVFKISKNDVVLVKDWNWFGYAEYLFNYQGEKIYLLGHKQNKQEKFNLIRDALVRTRKNQGKVYMLDWNSYSLGDINFLESLTGLTKQDFAIFEQKLAFSCQDKNVVELVSEVKK